MIRKYKSGEPVKIKISNHDLSKEHWEDAIFLSYVPDVRGGRYNVILHDGAIQRGVASECVKKIF